MKRVSKRQAALNRAVARIKDAKSDRCVICGRPYVDAAHLLPRSMLMGALFLLLVDNVSRNLLATEIPIGILTAFVGAPFFIYLMTRKESVL